MGMEHVMGQSGICFWEMANITMETKKKKRWHFIEMLTGMCRDNI